MRRNPIAGSRPDKGARTARRPNRVSPASTLALVIPPARPRGTPPLPLLVRPARQVFQVLIIPPQAPPPLTGRARLPPPAGPGPAPPSPGRGAQGLSGKPNRTAAAAAPGLAGGGASSVPADSGAARVSTAREAATTSAHTARWTSPAPGRTRTPHRGARRTSGGERSVRLQQGHPSQSAR